MYVLIFKFVLMYRLLVEAVEIMKSSQNIVFQVADSIEPDEIFDDDLSIPYNDTIVTRARVNSLM